MRTSGRTPEKADTVRVIGYRPQRTLAASAEIEGVGFITGARVRVRFRPRQPTPASSSTASIAHTPRPFPPASNRSPAPIAARRSGPAARGVTLVEHLLAALAGLRIDNCAVELDGPEPPGLDGSADGFVAALAAAGTVLQPARRPICTPAEPVVVSAGGATIGLHPRDEARPARQLLLDYGAFADDPAADVHARRSPRRVRPRGGVVPHVRHRGGGRGASSPGSRQAPEPGRPARVRPPRADRESAAVRRRAGPAQGARPDRRPGAVRVRPGRARGRVPLRARAERGTGPAVSCGCGRVSGHQVCKSSSRPGRGA